MLPKNFATTRDKWLTITKGAEVSGKSYSTISENADKGRIPFRSLSGKKRVYAPWISKFGGISKGNPGRIKNRVHKLDGESLKEFERLRENIEATHKDVVYDFVHKENEIITYVYLIVPVHDGKTKTVHVETAHYPVATYD